MSSVWKCVITFVVTALVISGIWFFVLHVRTEKITEKFEGELSQLTSTLDALGPSVECYTVSEDFSDYYDSNTAGQTLTEESLVPITIPSSLVGDAYITDPSKIIGKYCKVNIIPGTPITADLLMAEKFDDTLRDVDIVVDARVVGLRKGDYVDVRITMPYGEDYVILPHKRIQQMNSKTLKFYLTEVEWQLWQSATVDYYLHSALGCRIYLTKYVEPGVQQAATEWYAPSERVVQMMREDPNISVESQRYLSALASGRADVDNTLNEFVTEQTTVQSQAGLISGGRASWSSNVNGDATEKERDREAELESSGIEYVEDEDVVVNFDETEGEEDEVQVETEVPETEPDVESEPETEGTVYEPETSPAAIDDPDYVG